MERYQTVSQTGLILVVEDNLVSLNKLSRILKREGYGVQKANNGSQALASMERELPDLILLDIMMPGMDGYEVCQRLKADSRTRDIPVIFISALNATEDKVKAFAAGGVDYIPKPFQKEEVLARINTHLRLRELTERLEKKVHERTKELTTAVAEAKRLNRQLQREIAERKRTEDKIRRRNRELALLNHVIAAATSTLDAEHVLQVACDELARALDLPQSAAFTLNTGITEAKIVAKAGVSGLLAAFCEFIVAARDNLVEYMLKHQAPLALTEARTDEQLIPIQDLMREHNIVSAFIVPLKVRGKIVGAVGLGATEQRHFDKQETILAQNVASAIGQALETAQLHHELQRHMAELTRTLDKQRELDRLKSEFIQNVSHELRTPLAIARGYVELLDEGSLGMLRPVQREPVAVSARRLRMLSELVENINTVSKMQARNLEQEPVDLADLVQSTLIDFQVTAEENSLTLERDIAADLPLLHGDDILLLRMLDNLLSNAVKFTPSGGHITVRLWQEDTEIALEVSDTGIGIPEDKQERIFERFYQVNGSITRRYKGTGLGLALVKEIVEAHEGRVTVESTEGQGSTFTIWLPIAKE